MPLRESYVVWKANPVEWDTTEARVGDLDSPHGLLVFEDDDGLHQTNINVRSTDRVDHRLVFWTGDLEPGTAFGDHVITPLERLDSLTYHRNPPPLDFMAFFRDGFLDIAAGVVRDTNLPGPNNDITDDLDAFLDASSANFQRSTIFIWGGYYANSGGGVHQVHMNQGNYSRNSRWYRENGRRQDGGIVMRSPDGKWKYFFIAFAGQASSTDDMGRPKDGDGTPMLRDVLGAGPPVTPTRPVVPGRQGAVQIHSALVNPVGPDNTPGFEDRVRLVNRSDDAVPLDGWTIENQDRKSKQLPDVLLMGNGAMRDFSVGPESYLANNRDGEIVLKDAGGKEISRVSYRAGAQSGEWIPFNT